MAYAISDPMAFEAESARLRSAERFRQTQDDEARRRAMEALRVRTEQDERGRNIELEQSQTALDRSRVPQGPPPPSYVTQARPMAPEAPAATQPFDMSQMQALFSAAGQAPTAPTPAPAESGYDLAKTRVGTQSRNRARSVKDAFANRSIGTQARAVQGALETADSGLTDVALDEARYNTGRNAQVEDRNFGASQSNYQQRVGMIPSLLALQRRAY